MSSLEKKILANLRRSLAVFTFIRQDRERDYLLSPMAHVEALSPLSAVGSVKSWHATDVETLLSEKLLEGYSLLNTSCPQCVTPLVKRKAPTMTSPTSNQPVSKGTSPHMFMSFASVQPQPAAHGTVTDSSGSIEAPFSPVSGVPFCVSCKAHVVTRDADMQALERCNSLKDKGCIIVAIDEDRQDFEVHLPERPLSSTREMTSPSIREEAEQENPVLEASAFDAIEEQRFFGERDMSPLLEVNNTSIKKPKTPVRSPKTLSPLHSPKALSPVHSAKALSPIQSPKALSPIQSPKSQVDPPDAEREDVPAFEEAIEEERDMAPEETTPLRVETDFEKVEVELDTIAVKTPIDAPGTPTSTAVTRFMCSPKHTSPSPDTVPITMTVDKPLLSEDPEDDEEAAPLEEEVPKTTVSEEGAEEGIEQDLNEHKRTMGTMGETAAHVAMLPPRPVTSDLLHPTEKEELDNERRKSLTPSAFVEATGFSDAPEADLDEVETHETLQEYGVRREIATKVLGSKMLQGYFLVEEQCLKCGMPLMENKGQIDCVVCPVLVKKAKKKMKEQEEERILAEQRAKVEAKMAAQKKAEEEAAAVAKASDEEPPAAKIKAKEEAAAAKAKAEQKGAAAMAVADEEEGKRRAAKEAAMRAPEEEAFLKMEPKERAIEADEAELMFAFTDQDLFGAEEEARLAEEEHLLQESLFGKSAPDPDCAAKADEEQSVEETRLEKEQVALSVVVQEALQGPVTEEQLALRAALDALHVAEEEERLAQEAAEEDSLLEEMLSKEQKTLRVAEEEERLALQLLKEAEEAERLCLEALRAAEEEEQKALETFSVATKDADEQERLALEALKAAEEEERLTQEAVRAEEEKILAEKAVEDARLALEQARAEMEQKKLRETEAMRKEQTRIAYHARLEEEARRAAEIAIAEKARREAEEEMRREELERQAAEEALIIEALETEANEKSKVAEAAWLEAKAALDQVSNARRKIIQKTIAQAEVEALAEAEEIVMSQNKGYKEPPQLPPTRSEIEAEQWETLRCEGRAQMTRRLLQGWTMLPELCRGKECANTPLLLSKDGRKVQCVVCDGCGNGIDGVYEAIDATYESDDAVEDDEEASDTGSKVEEAADTNNLVDEDSYEDDASSMTEKESFEEPPVPPTSVGTQSPSTPTAVQSVDKLNEDFETKRSYVSKEIGRKMMQGWTLLDMSCDECMMPLMYNPDRDEETCVLCGTAVRELPIFQEPKNQTRNDPPEDHPPGVEEDEEELESSILEEKKLDSHVLVEEDPTEEESHLSKNPPTADEDEDELESRVPPENEPAIKEETLIAEKLTIDVMDEEELELKKRTLSSTASKDIADFLLAVPTAIEEDYNEYQFGCDTFDITNEVDTSRRLQVKPKDIDVGQQHDVIEEQCEIEVAVIVSLTPDESPVPSPAVHEEENIVGQPEISKEDEYTIELMQAAPSFAAPSFDEAHIPVEKPTAQPVKRKQETPVVIKKPTADLDEEDRGEELIVVTSVVAPLFDKEQISIPPPPPPPPTAQRPPRPVSKGSSPNPSMKHAVAKSSNTSTRARRGPPKPEGKSPSSRTVPRSLAYPHRQSPRAYSSNQSPRGFEMNDDDSAGSSRMEFVANSALDAILNHIEDCKTNLNESSDPEFIMTQLAMIEKLSTAAMAMRKLEEMS